MSEDLASSICFIGVSVGTVISVTSAVDWLTGLHFTAKTLLITLGAVAGGINSAIACELLGYLFSKTRRWSRYQPCGPAHGAAVLRIGPAAGAIIWLCYPPLFWLDPAPVPVACCAACCAAAALSAVFASLGASD